MLKETKYPAAQKVKTIDGRVWAAVDNQEQVTVACRINEMSQAISIEITNLIRQLQHLDMCISEGQDISDVPVQDLGRLHALVGVRHSLNDVASKMGVEQNVLRAVGKDEEVVIFEHTTAGEE